MSDPFQARVFGAAWIGICKSLLTIENSINSALFLPLRVPHLRAGMLDGASSKHTSRGIPFYLLRLCGKLYKEMLRTWRAQKLFLIIFSFAMPLNARESLEICFVSINHSRVYNVSYLFSIYWEQARDWTNVWSGRRFEVKSIDSQEENVESKEGLRHWCPKRQEIEKSMAKRLPWVTTQSNYNQFKTNLTSLMDNPHQSQQAELSLFVRHWRTEPKYRFSQIVKENWPKNLGNLDFHDSTQKLSLNPRTNPKYLYFHVLTKKTVT